MEHKKVQEGSHAAPETYYIAIQKNGPYLVYGKPPINHELLIPDETGWSWSYQQGEKVEDCESPIALCRCGQSKHKPCCDGTHEDVEWDAAETAAKDTIAPQQFTNQDFILNDNKEYCATARFCDGHGDIWHLLQKKELTEGEKNTVKHQGKHCPSGRLRLQNATTGEIYEPKFDPGIGILEDPVLKVSGPIWVKGGIRVQSAGGESYTIRNRVTLCRCGHSSNKPFCDGTHVTICFKDSKFHIDDKVKDVAAQAYEKIKDDM
ncbi:MAG: CDGSH iron-sulfur domain-containing protein [Candidatus Symbiothrix sp.]|jgi:CDGSH-type Zn-finger protein|nr:CDGSH iron-sulfur domain-containing protein [Candidatus Symbiothrix sp.]